MSPYKKREPDYRKSPSRMKQPESELGRPLFTLQPEAGCKAGWLQGLQTAVASRVRTAWEEAFSVGVPCGSRTWLRVLVSGGEYSRRDPQEKSGPQYVTQQPAWRLGPNPGSAWALGSQRIRRK